MTEHLGQSGARPKASDIPDRDMLAVVLAENVRRDGWAMAWDICERLPQFPDKVIAAKLRRLKDRGLLDGCPCGCRGDWQLTRAGAELLGVARYYNSWDELGWMTVGAKPQPTPRGQSG